MATNFGRWVGAYLFFVTALQVRCDVYDNYGELYYDYYEQPPGAGDTQRRLPSTSPPGDLDVQYDVSLEEVAPDDDNEQFESHPALKKYSTFLNGDEEDSMGANTRTTTPVPQTSRKMTTLRRIYESSQITTTTETTTSESSPPISNDDIGARGNLLTYLDYRKEENSCPDGYVLDIYGYCRLYFYEENRDWEWWIQIRNFIMGSYDPGYIPSY